MASLHHAIIQRRWRQARLLVEVGADVNRQGDEGRTPLMELCFVDNEDKACSMAKLLLENGGNVGIKDKQGKTALSYACILKKKKLLKWLTRFVDYDLNSTDLDGNTALNYAILAGDETVVMELVRKLKAYGLTVDTINRKGETPLINALKSERTDIADILLEIGKASLQVWDSETGKTASELRKDIIKRRKRRPFSIPSAFLREVGDVRPKRGNKEKKNKVKSANTKRVVLPQVLTPYNRPVTAPDRIDVPSFFQPFPPIWEDLSKLFIIYNQQSSDLYRKGYKSVRYVHVEPIITEDEIVEEDDTASLPENAKGLNELNIKMRGLCRAAGNKKKIMSMLANRGKTDSEESGRLSSLSATGRGSKLAGKLRAKSPAVQAFASLSKDLSKKKTKENTSAE
ncbi:predicted protein [Nematostella vectensis]|uniref:Uncharacterized protein n=1 Tax=Nematostella vectensis TaxID=45351 RepID=A7S546_NEMVE|nr:ankyrin repeat domain-containing protein 36A [Nematostella vectensis]EDO41179.1 predicted protein [Nematostella vectensis]|eukprot:XP_001633242.1 predicted protein [Nematostella vectensis]